MSDLLVRLQKHIFLITLVGACFLGFSLAYLSSVVLSYAFQSTPTPTTRRSAGRSSAKPTAGRQYRGFDTFESVVTGNFIRDSGSALSLGTKGEEGGDVEEIKLVGLLAGSPRFARAAIEVKGKPGVEEYRTGALVGGHKIISINSNSITVERGGRSFNILIGAKSTDQAQSSATTTGGTGGKKIPISRTRLKKLLANPAMMSSMGATPFIHQGKMVGLRITRLPSNHVFYKLGARPRDIIRRFNGDRLDSQQKLIAIYTSLKTMSRATIDLERGGKILSFDIVVQD